MLPYDWIIFLRYSLELVAMGGWVDQWVDGWAGGCEAAACGNVDGWVAGWARVVENTLVVFTYGLY